MRNIFKNRKVNAAKLSAYGFVRTENGYSYAATLAEQFRIVVRVSENGDVCANLIDIMTNEEYALVNVEGASGGFVSMVKAEYEAKLADIADKCFDGVIFGSRQAQEVIGYIRSAYGDELQYLWDNFPEDAVFRRRDNAKWYGAMMYLTDDKIGRSGDTYVDIIDLKATPATIANIDGKKILPAYHMNKNHWITICLDGSMETGEICRLIDESYMLAGKK